MQSTDYTAEERALLDRLHAFTPVYEQAATDFLAHLEELYPYAKQDNHVLTILDVDKALLEYIPDEWSDIRARVADEYHYKEDVWAIWYMETLIPIKYRAVDAARDWWKATYISHLDYSYPLSPDPLPTTVVKINQRVYKIGQLELHFLNEQRFRKIELRCKDALLDDHYESVNLKTLPQTIHTIYAPRILPLLSLCDWDQFATFAPKQKEAVAYKYREIKWKVTK